MGKIRITASARGTVGELFSMEETSDETVEIYIKRAKINRKSKSPDQIRQNRVSIHPTQGKEYCTINHHVERADGLKRTGISKILPVAGRISYLLHSQATIDLRFPAAATKPKIDDKLICLGEYDPRHGTLVYSIIATDLATRIKVPKNLNHKQFPFTHHIVHVFWGYMLRPSTYEDHVIVSQSGHTFKTDEDCLIIPAQQISSSSDHELREAILVQHQQLWTMQTGAYVRHVAAHGKYPTPEFFFVQPTVRRYPPKLAMATLHMRKTGKLMMKRSPGPGRSRRTERSS